MAVSVYTGAGAGVASFNGRTGKVVPADGDYTKAQVGLGNVDNTSDANKPISTATQAALNDKQSKITANGILKGDGAGNITAADAADLPKEIFWATYGETTAEELMAAYDAGKVIKVKEASLTYDLTEIYGSSYFYFQNISIKSERAPVRRLVFNFTTGTWEYPEIIGYIFDKLTSISLPAASWTGSDPYTQRLTITGLTTASGKNARIDIQPSEEIYDQLVADNVGYLAIKNMDGILIAVAKGGKPSVDLTVQVTYNNVY